MQEYCIMTDVTADLPPEILKQCDVEALPMPFKLGGGEYTHYADFREVSVNEFYRRIQAGETASTSQVTYATFVKYFTPCLEAGKDILYIAFSSALSGTYQGAVVAAQELMEKYPGRRIVCVDTRAASAGEGMLIYYAAAKKAEGMSLDALASWLEENKLKMCHWFTVDDLHSLHRGGRISTVSWAVGSMLKIKPVLHVDNEGRLIPMRKVRGRKKALQYIIERAIETGVDLAAQTVFICQAYCMEDARHIEAVLRERAGVKQVIITDIGPIIGAHVGPGTISVFFFGRER